MTSSLSPLHSYVLETSFGFTQYFWCSLQRFFDAWGHETQDYTDFYVVRLNGKVGVLWLWLLSIVLQNAYAKIIVVMNHRNYTLKQAFLRTLVVVAFGVLVVLPTAQVYARSISEIQEEINQKRQEASDASEQSGHLHKKAETEEEKIAELQNQIAGIQAKIDSNVIKQDDLKSQIQLAQKRLEEQKVLLSANIRSMYIEGDISPLEMLASSKNISDFVDKQEYRDRIKENITNTLDEIEDLKKQLDEQRAEIVKIIEEKKTQRGILADKRAEANNKLASLNISRAEFENKIKKQSAEIAELRAQQLAANQTALGGNIVAGDPGRGGYPSMWANAPQDSLVDSWGMYNRECVSYTAWKVHQSGRNMPYWGGVGNANQWPGNASAAGIPVNGTPKVGSVAISMAGYYGHAMYVEAVSGNMIYVSQYNYAVQGEYSEMWVSKSGLQFIHFPWFFLTAELAAELDGTG